MTKAQMNALLAKGVTHLIVRNFIRNNDIAEDIVHITYPKGEHPDMPDTDVMEQVVTAHTTDGKEYPVKLIHRKEKQGFIAKLLKRKPIINNNLAKE